MYITKIELTGFRWVNIHGNIKKITIESMNHVQILIGSNGSGKSSICEQISPLPASKSDYLRCGKKVVHILHEGVEYVLTSDFETKAGKHSFKKNGQELNVSGLSTLQTDLCRDHLNYTLLMDNLTHCRFQMAQMSIAERKSLLLSMSPSTPEFVIQLHKKAKTQLRSIRSNLTLLETRKAEIETKLLSAEEFAVFEKERTELQTKHLTLANEIYLLQSRLEEYKKELADMGIVKEIDVEKMKKYRLRLQNLLMVANNYRKDDTAGRVIDAITQGLNKYQLEYQHHVDEYERLSEELKRYDAELVTADGTEQVDHEQVLISKLKQLSELKEYEQYKLIPPDKLHQHESAYHRMYEMVNATNQGIERHWDHAKYLSKIESKNNYLKFKVGTLGGEVSENADRREKLEAKVFGMLAGPREVGDNCKDCDYMQEFAAEREAAKKELKAVTEKSKKLISRYERYIRAQTFLDIKYKIVRDQVLIATDLSRYSRGTIWDMDFDAAIAILNGDKQSWIHQVKMTLGVQEKLILKQELEKDIMATKLAIEVVKKSSTPAMAILKKMCVEKRERLTAIQALTDALGKKIVNMQEHLEIEQRVENLIQTGERLQTEIEAWHEYVMLSTYVDFLGHVLQDLLWDKDATDKKIFELTKIIKEQENYKARYEEEILKLLTTLKEKEALVSYLELGLSPESGMPRYHVLQFINAILDNVNFILGKIWTTPLVVERLVDSDNVDCDFKVCCNGRSHTPLNKLSKSLKAVVNFAFSIAMIYATNGADYPIFFDECDDGFDTKHKQTYLDWLKLYMDAQYAPQLWMVSHDAALYAGFIYKDIVCLNGSNLMVPQEANRYTKIEK